LKNLDFALWQVSQLKREGTIKISTSIMNVLMSAAAERGDIHQLLSLLKEFEVNSIAFNADTISFGFESLGKNLLYRRKYNSGILDRSKAATRDHIDACMVVAHVLLNHMDDHQVKTTDHIIRNYVEFLCIAGHVDTATSILLEAVNETGLVSSKSIYRVAMANAKNFRFEVARHVATCDRSSEPYQFLIDAINREELLFQKSISAQNSDQLLKSSTSGSTHPSVANPLPNSDDRESNSSPTTSMFWKPQTKSE
jgi:hypothetical protein